MQRPNVTVVKTAEVERGFMVGMGFWVALAELRGLPVGRIHEVVAAAIVPPVDADSGAPELSAAMMRARQDILYAAALNYVESHSLLHNFTRADAMEWQNEMATEGVGEVLRLVMESRSSLFEGKSLAELLTPTSDSAPTTPPAKKSKKS